MAASRAKRTPPRVVLDTDQVLSALVLSGGATESLRRGWQSGRFTPLASKATVGELVGGLAWTGFALTADEQEELLFDYLLFCEIVEAGTSAPSAPARRNPSDLPSLELAITGRAKCLVTDNRDLPSLAPELSCRIVGADEFLARLEPA